MAKPRLSKEDLEHTLQVYEQSGFSLGRAAELLGVHQSTLWRRLESAKQRGLDVPSGQMMGPPVLGENITGVSTLLDGEGNIKSQWVKTQNIRENKRLALEAAAAALCEEIPRQSPIPPPKLTKDALCNVYTLTDCHVGMLSWHRETGENWDLEIAERVLQSAFSHAVRSSPTANTGVVAQLGDFLHSDGLLPVTPTSNHILDQDGRFEKVVKVAIRILRSVINEALKHHDNVIVINAEGNHDMASSVWLRQLLSALYENEPRVTVLNDPLPYYALQWGYTALFWHHGHLKRFAGIFELLPAQFAEIWGRTTKRYCHMGHMHHTHVKEHAGVEVRQHPTIAARDAYAARGGWFGMRAIRTFTYHRDYGEVGSSTTTLEMLEESNDQVQPKKARNRASARKSNPRSRRSAKVRR